MRKLLNILCLSLSTTLAATSLEEEVRVFLSRYEEDETIYVDEKRKEIILHFNRMQTPYHKITKPFLFKHFDQIKFCLGDVFYKIKNIKLDHCEKILGQASRLIKSQITGDDFYYLIEVLSCNHISCISRYVDHAIALITDDHLFERVQLIEQMNKSSLYLDEKVEAIQKFLMPATFRSDYIAILRSLNRLSVNEISNICQVIGRIKYKSKSVDHYDRLIGSIQEIPIVDRESVIDDTLAIFKPQMTHDDFCVLIRFLYEKVYNHPGRSEIINFAKDFTSDKLEENKSMLGALINLSEEERYKRINRVYKERLRERGFLSLNEVLVYLQLPIDTKMSDQYEEEGNDVYSFGIVAEEGYRIYNTRQAIKSLLCKQGAFDYKMLEAAYNRFLVEMTHLPLQKQKTIKKVLGLIEMPKQAFLPFLAEESLIFNYGMPPRHLLGHLFLFIETYEGEVINGVKVLSKDEIKKERNNMQKGLFTGLENCLEEDGSLVCEIGKLQKVLIPVLQGRLPGVNIDDLNFNVREDAILEDEKNQLEEILIWQIKGSKVDSEEIFNVFKEYFPNTNIDLRFVENYVEFKMNQLALMRKYEEYRFFFMNELELENSKIHFFNKHPEIVNDHVLKTIFLYEMDQAYEIGRSD